MKARCSSVRLNLRCVLVAAQGVDITVPSAAGGCGAGSLKPLAREHMLILKQVLHTGHATARGKGRDEASSKPGQWTGELKLKCFTKRLQGSHRPVLGAVFSGDFPGR